MGLAGWDASQEPKVLGEDLKIEENKKGEKIEHDLVEKEGIRGCKHDDNQKGPEQEQLG